MLAQAGTFPGMQPGRVGGVAAEGQSPDKAAAAAKNKQMAQEPIDQQRDEAARRLMVEQWAKLRERLEREAGLLRQPVDLLASMFQLRGGQVPRQVPPPPDRAFEDELDAASLTRAATAAAPDPAQLRDGTTTRRIGIEWVRPEGR